MKKVDLRNFTKFTGKHVYQSLFFNKVAGLRPAPLLKKRLWHRCLFSCEFCGIFKNTFFKEHFRETDSVDSLAYLDNNFNDNFVIWFYYEKRFSGLYYVEESPDLWVHKHLNETVILLHLPFDCIEYDQK